MQVNGIFGVDRQPTRPLTSVTIAGTFPLKLRNPELNCNRYRAVALIDKGDGPTYRVLRKYVA